MSKMYVNELLPKDSARVAIPGHVIQVVSVNGGDGVSIATSTQTDIFSASITPTYSNSKILVLSNVHVYRNASGHNEGRLLRDSTIIAQDSIRDSYGAFHSNWVFSKLDSPNTTSSVTYKVTGAIRSGESGTMYINDGSSYESIITLLEIAQ